MSNNDKPLIVDLDGSLIHSDSLLESLMLLLKQHFFSMFFLPFWLFKGKAYFKQRINQLAPLDAKTLPYNVDVLDFVRAQKAAGRSCYLATGSVLATAEAVNEYLQLFDEVFASDGQNNLTGSKKAALLNQRFGVGEYDYLGNHAVDLKIWQDCNQAIVVSAGDSLLKKAQQVCSNTQHIAVQAATVKTYVKAIRVHQWVKNALIAVPLLASHLYFTSDLLLACIIGFLAYSFAASSVYVLNDLLDLAADRQHATKCRRPFASGQLSIVSGIFLFPALLFAAFILAYCFTPLNFVYALAVYYALTVLYSFHLKRIVMLDTILLAALYTMRIIAGTLLIEVEFSFWLLAFSMFIFLSLALLKRYTELLSMQADGQETALGRGYHANDASMVASFGAASAYIAVLVLALYVDSSDVTELYKQPFILWLTCPIMLYWISRAWLLAHRGQMHDDPIVFAVKDRQSLFIGLLILLVFIGAS